MEISSRHPRFCLGTYEGTVHGIGVAKKSSGAKTKSKSRDRNRPELVCWFAALNHIGAVRTVACSESGRWLVSGGSDETLHVYDLQSLREHGTLHRHEDAISCIDFFSDSHMLSGSEDGMIYIWETKRWECLTSLRGHVGPVNDIGIHHSGKVALSVGKDRSLRMWNLVTGRHMLARQFKKGEPMKVVWSPVGASYAVLFPNRLMVCDEEGNIISQHKMQSKGDIAAAGGTSFHSVAYIHEFALAVGTEAGEILIWDMLNHRIQARLQHGPLRVRSLAMIFGTEKSLDLLLSGSTDGSTKVWNILRVVTQTLRHGDENDAETQDSEVEGREEVEEDQDTPMTLEEERQRAETRSREDYEKFGVTEYRLPKNRALSLCVLGNNPYQDSGAAAAAILALAQADGEDIEEVKAAEALEDEEILDRKGKDIKVRRKQRKKQRDQARRAKLEQELGLAGEEEEDEDSDFEIVAGPANPSRRPSTASSSPSQGRQGRKERKGKPSKKSATAPGKAPKVGGKRKFSSGPNKAKAASAAAGGGRGKGQGKSKRSTKNIPKAKRRKQK